MKADDLIPMSIASALAYGRLLARPTPPSPRELNEQLELMATILATAVPASEWVDGQVRVAALFAAIERLRHEAAA